jgi:hypothetical protein
MICVLGPEFEIVLWYRTSWMLAWAHPAGLWNEAQSASDPFTQKLAPHFQAKKFADRAWNGIANLSADRERGALDVVSLGKCL